MKIYFDNILINDDYYTQLSQDRILFNEGDTFSLGSTICTKIKLGIDKRIITSHPSNVRIEIDNKVYGNYIVDNADIETDFVCEDYIVYRLTRYKRYDYYSIDSNGNSKFLMTTNLALSFKYYKDNAFYMMNEDDFFVYDIKTEVFNEISFNDYCIALELSYYGMFKK